MLKDISGLTAKQNKKKCINCLEDHGALAMKCQRRKLIIKEKKEEIERQKMTFADITKGHSNITSQTLTKSFTMPVITKEELLKDTHMYSPCSPERC